MTKTLKKTSSPSCEALRREMAVYYRMMGKPESNPEYTAIRGKIVDTMEGLYSEETPGVTLKSLLHETMAEYFEPVVFPHSPFFFEMGLRRSRNWGTPEFDNDDYVPNSWLLRKRYFSPDSEVLRNIYGDSTRGGEGAIGLTTINSPFDADHHCVGYTKLFKKGFNGILDEIRIEKEKTPEAHKDKLVFLDAADRSCRAMLKGAAKFALKAETVMSGNADPVERKFLEMTARCARRIPANPPESFYEGLAMLWFVREAMATFEGIGISVVGHLDRLLYPLYEKDLQSGMLSREEAKELAALWLLPTDIKFDVAGDNKYAVETSTCMELGGCDEQGRPVWNELTRLFIEVHEEMGLLNPKPNCRYSSKSPQDYLEKLSSSVLRGHNNFALLNDDILIPAQIKSGKSPEEARLYVNGGCQEIMVEGVEHTAGAYYYLSLPRVLDLCLRELDGPPPFAGPDTYSALPEVIKDAASFEEYYAAFMSALKKTIGIHLGRCCEAGATWREIHPCPLFSVTLENCIEKGLDYTAGGAKYNNSTMCLCGVGTLIDSLYAIKKAVFDEKIIGFEELRELLARNWEGAEDVRRRFIAYPKFGHDEGEVDALAAEFIEEVSGFAGTVPNERGGVFWASMFVYGAYLFFAPFVRATPDGRRAGDVLSQGIAPGRLRTVSSVTDTIRSLGRINFENVASNSVLDVQLPLGRLDPVKMAALLKTFSAYKCPTIQPNVVSIDALRDAQVHPERHQDLMVRLYGLSAYFVLLSEESQNEIISRNLYN